MTIFWDPADQRWCDESVMIFTTRYHSLALLQDEQVIPDESYIQATKNKQVEKHRSCRMKWR